MMLSLTAVRGVSLTNCIFVEALSPSMSDAPPSQENVAFAAELIKARGELGLTQSQLSAKSGVSLSAIKGYEIGRTMPGARELRDLCRALQVTPNKLLFGAETPFFSLHANDPASIPGEKGEAVNRNRIASLVRMLAFDEVHAIYSLVRSIALARFGNKDVHAAIEAADLMTSIQLLKDGGMIESDLLPKDPALLRSMADALKAAVNEGKSSTIPLNAPGTVLRVSKVSKK